jgi:DNA repair photolyase
METQEVLSKSILTKTSGFLVSEYTHSLNPYEGCTFSCKFCYVRESQIQLTKPHPWGEWLRIKSNAAELYRKEAMRERKKQRPLVLFMSSSTDPYQPIEIKQRITRSVLEAMLEVPPDFVLLQTRSPLVLQDLPLLQELSTRCRLRVSMTVETDREDVRMVFAPHAPGIRARIHALRTLHEAGISTQVAVAPLLPFTRDFPEQLVGIVDRVVIDTMSLGDGSKGRRSARLGMPELFAQHDWQDWYAPDIHERVARYFMKYFPEDMVRLSLEGFAP